MSGDSRLTGGRTSPWEWVAAGVSTVLVLGAIGYMLREAIAEPNTPPLIEVTVDTVLDTRSGYLVEFRAHNRGTSTATGLTVQGALRSDTGAVETSEVTIDFVPGSAVRRGGLYFTEDPRRYTLEIRPKGYDRP